MESAALLGREGARRRPVVVVCVVAALGWASWDSAVSAATTFVWSGQAQKGSPGWSLGENWQGGVAPSAPWQVSLGQVSLEFPRLTGSACLPSLSGTCYVSRDDLSGMSAESVRIDDGDEYVLEGEPFAIGAGGLAASPGSGSIGRARDVFSLPVRLSASQSWTVAGRGYGNPGENGVRLEDGVSGAGDSLTVSLNSDAAIGFRGDSETGPVAVSGDRYTVATLLGKLNATDGSSVAANGVIFGGSGVVGPLRSSGAVLVPWPRIEAASATLSAASTLVMTIARHGNIAGYDYSILDTRSKVDLQSVSLAVETITEGCEPFTVGQTYTILSTAGEVEGSFGNATGGMTVPIVTLENCAVKQLLKIAYHRSGGTQSITGTVVEDNGPPLPENTPTPYESTLEPGIAEGAAAAAARQAALYEAEQRKKQEEAEASRRPAPALSVQQTPPPASTPPRSARAVLLSDRLRVTHGRFAQARVRCSGSAGCAGTLALTVNAKPARRHGERSHSLVRTIGAARFSLAAGTQATVSIRLNSRGRALLRAHRGRLNVVLAIAQRTPAPQRAFSRQVRLIVR